MDTKSQLAQLYQVQQLDSALDALKRQYAGLDQGKAEKAAFEAAQAAFQAADAAVHASSATLHDAELEQKSVEVKTAEVEKKLYGGSVRVPKELQAMQEEIEMMKRQRGRLDEKILTTMDELETLRRNHAETGQAQAAAQEALAAKQAAYKAQSEQTVAQARALNAQRIEAVKAVEAPLLKRYESLRSGKQGVGIAALVDGNACGGCKMGLPTTLVTQVREAQAIQVCPNCGRMLCAPEK